MVTEAKQIVERLDVIKSELDYIKENMIPIDALLTEEDRDALVKAREEYKKRETTATTKARTVNPLLVSDLACINFE